MSDVDDDGPCCAVVVEQREIIPNVYGDRLCGKPARQYAIPRPPDVQWLCPAHAPQPDADLARLAADYHEADAGLRREENMDSEHASAFFTMVGERDVVTSARELIAYLVQRGIVPAKGEQE